MIVFPAEWYPQSCIQLTWPHRGTDWISVYDEAIACFRNLAHEISVRQVLIIACEDSSIVLDELSGISLDNIRIGQTGGNDTWARDHGGITVFIDGIPTIYDFTFNGWGLKFASAKDNQITQQFFGLGIFECRYESRLGFVFEGGGIESNGEGVLMTTEDCLLSANRNEHLDKDQIESYLKDQFGAHSVLWLSHGYLAGDDTDSHIDTLARFASPDHIIYVQCSDPADEHFEALSLMERELIAFRQPNGDPFRLTPLPMVPAISDGDDRLPATYANFLIMNTTVLMPTYGVETDVMALNVARSAFPGKEIVGVDCSVLIKQHGSLHCVTMQYPLGVFENK